MREQRWRATVEVEAPIDAVWEQLTRAWLWLDRAPGPWRVEPGSWDLWATPLDHRLRVSALGSGLGELRVHSVTTTARCPDRLTWELSGDLTGTVDFELDDLDATTFVCWTWRVRPSSRRHLLAMGPVGRGAIGQTHLGATRQLATALADTLGSTRARVRCAGDHRRRAVELSV